MKPIPHSFYFLALITPCLCAPGVLRADTFGLEILNLQFVEQGWGEPHANQSVDGYPLSIGGKRFEHGLGTHAVSTFRISLAGKGERFTAQVGVDDEVGQGVVSYSK